MNHVEQRGRPRPYHEAVSYLTRLVRAGIAFAGMVVLGWLGGCSDGSGPVCCDLPQGLIVSDPVAATGLAAGTGMAVAMASTAADTVVFVSLPPGTVPAGSRAIVRRVGDAATLTTTVLDGGFDPVPVGAEAGDSVEVFVRDAAGGTVLQARLAVVAVRPPIVVRTNPPRRKTDVPVNAAIVVVFSEPVAGASLTPASVRLLRSGNPVAGTVSLLQGTAAAAVFVPSVPLEANADYELVVTRAVRDLSGDAVPADVTVEFTTGTTVLGAVASVAVQPDSAEVAVGSRFQMVAIPRDAQGDVLAGRPVVWTSDPPSVATVSATGIVTAVAEGGASISAAVEGLSGYSNIRVSATLVPVASVTVSPETTSVFAGRTVQLVVEARDSAGNIISAPRPVTWATSTPTVATLTPTSSHTAAVTGVAPGVATIAATIEGKSDTARVTVLQAPLIVGFTLSPDTATIVLQATVRLTGIATAEDGYESPVPGSQIAWGTSDPTVALADGAGLVSGAGTGSATITGAWGGFNATARVTVVSMALTTLTAGASHTCGLTASGTAFCWGYNGGGQLGNGTTSDKLSPLPAAMGLTFATLTAGNNHTCGLTTSGVAYCWGLNYYGELGNGTTTQSSMPVPVAGGLTFVTLDAGSWHTCGIATGGAAYCWGNNWDGQLGTGTTNHSSVPVPVSGGLAFKSLEAGEWHTCALDTGGAAYCWGRNTAGLYDLTPVAVGGGLTFTALTTGVVHACGLTAGGTAYCWGINLGGPLGDGTETDRASPVPVTGGHTFTALSAGEEFTCGVASGGAAYCWGVNYYGQLGNGTTGNPSLTPVPVVSGLAFARVSTSGGGYHACGLTTTQVAYCWGFNNAGGLGDGTTINRSAPVKVLGQP
jgi:alpha-tubulin suppressor-like RCC1 family protein